MAIQDNVATGSTVILASAARTATPTIDTFRTRPGARDLLVIVDVTAVTSTPSTVFTILGYDPVSGKTWTVLASAAIATVQTLVLRVSPELTGSANLIAKDIVPAYFTITAVHGNANSMTYTIGYSAP